MNFKKNVLFISCLIATLGLLTGFYQVTDISLDKILKQLEAYAASHPQEKLYLHLDKPAYMAGDDLWFKGYLVDGTLHRPDSMSGIVYVELINGQRQVVAKRVLKAERGFLSGDFNLSDTLAEGTYQIRAYTGWMKNFDEAYFYHQNLKIWSLNAQVAQTNISFRRVSTSAGDSIIAYLTLFRYPGDPIANKRVKYALLKEGNRYQSGSLLTTNAGNGILRFFSPKQAKDIPTAVQIVFNHADKAVQKEFPILTAREENNSGIDLQLLPEGGQLVINVESKVAIKALAASGKGVEVEGTVIDETGVVVANFKSTHLGMGTFRLKPLPGKTYRARLSLPVGSSDEYPLPAAAEEGLVLSVDNSRKDLIRVRIQTNAATIRNYKAADIILVGQMRGVVYFAAQAPLSRSVFEAEVPRSKFPDSGIVQFTLFDAQAVPQAERLVFVNQHQALKITLKADKKAYKSREKVNLHLQVTNAEGQPVAGNFSLAVTDDQQVLSEELYAGNILTNLLLTSDLRGTVEQPGFYFDEQEPTAAQALDYLMMTQGWRRFVWKDVIENNFSLTPFPIERGLMLSGSVTKLNQKPATNTLVTLLAPKEKNPLFITKTDELGNFYFDSFHYEDSTRAILQAGKARQTLSYVLKLDLPQSPSSAFLPFVNTQTDDFMQQYLKEDKQRRGLDQYWKLHKVIQLNEVIIQGKKQVAVSDPRRLHSYADAVIKVSESKIIYSDVIQMLQGRLAGVQVSGNFPNYSISIQGNQTPPLFILDGMAINQEASMSFVTSISVQDIETVEILRGANAYIYGSRASGGVIAIYTKRGNPNYDYSKETSSGVLPLRLSGFNRARIFYSPDYSVPQPTHQRPDYRSVLYWNPTIVTDDNGVATVSFYTSDGNTAFKAIIQGLSLQGLPGKADYSFKVE